MSFDPPGLDVHSWDLGSGDTIVLYVRSKTCVNCRSFTSPSVPGKIGSVRAKMVSRTDDFG